MTHQRRSSGRVVRLGWVLLASCSGSGAGQPGGAPVEAGPDQESEVGEASADQSTDQGTDQSADGSEEASPEGIVLVSPISDITSLEAAQDPPFVWSKATAAQYVLTIEKKFGGAWNPWVSHKGTAATLCSASACSLETGLDYYEGKYRWRVTNGAGTVSSPTVTITSTVPDPAQRNLDVVGPEETLGRGAKTPQIAVDAAGSPHVVAYHKNGADNEHALRMYNKTTQGTWQTWIVAQTQFGASETNATGLDASRIYIPDIVIDDQSRGWVLARVASQITEGGTLLGHSVWIVEALQSSAPQITKYKYFARDGDYGRQGNLSLDPSQPGFVYMAVGSKVSQARWYRLDAELNQVGFGDIPMGSTGEKFRFEISPRQGKKGILHMVGLGDTSLPNVYQNSAWASGGGDSVPWLPMGEFGPDFTHPSIGIDHVKPEVAYLGIQTAVADNGVRINIWDGTKLLFAPADAPRFDGPAAEDPWGNGEGRFGPQWTPARGGGAFLCWTSPTGTIKIRYVKPSPNPQDFGPILEVTDGVQCSLATDGAGDLHLVYGRDGDMKYRKITTK